MSTDYIELITTALHTGKYDDAERSCRAGLVDLGEDEHLLLLLAITLQFQQRMPEAIAIQQRLIELFPQSSLHWGNYGTTLKEAGHLNDALIAYEKAINLDPNNASPLVNLGLMQLRSQQYIVARENFLKAHAIDATSPMIRIHAARAAINCRDFEDAWLLLKPWRTWSVLEDELHIELASLLLATGDGASASMLLEDMVVRAPKNALAKAHLIFAYERLNRVSEAEQLLGELLELQDHLDQDMQKEVIHLQAKLAMREGDYAVARTKLEALGPRAITDVAHHFSLAEIYDKQGEVALAMNALQVAHAEQMEGLRQLFPGHFNENAAVLPAAVPRVTSDEYATWPSMAAPDTAQSPIFIVGFPRSGTTLLEQMLDAHPALQSMDENPFFNNLSELLEEHGILIPQDIPRLTQRDCDELRKRYLQMVCETIPRNWSAQLVDKNPLNLLWLPLIHRLFPRAKFILALRHPCDVMFSCYMQNFRTSMLASACASLPRLAVAYVTAMQSWLHHVDVFKPDVLIMRYEELVGDFSSQVKRLADFIKLENGAPLADFDEHARKKGFIGTPSYSQVIQPVSGKAVNRWERYRDYYAEALPIVLPMIDHWGYTI